MGSRKLGAQQVEVGSQGPSARLSTASSRILGQQDALLPSGPSPRRTAEVDAFTSSKWRAIVLGTPGMRRRGAAHSPGQGGWSRSAWMLSLQEPHTRYRRLRWREAPSGVANDWVISRPPSSVHRRFEGEHCVFLPRHPWRPALPEDPIARTERWPNLGEHRGKRGLFSDPIAGT